MKKLKEMLAKLLTEIRELNEMETRTEEQDARLNVALGEAEALRGKVEQSERAAGLESWASESATEPIKPEIEEPEVRAGRNRAAGKKYATLGEQLADVIRAEPGQHYNPESVERLMEVRATGLSEGIPADGGFLVQTDFATQILQRTYDNSAIAGRCTPITISETSNSVTFPAVAETSRADGSRLGGVRGYWVAEAGSKTASQPAFGTVELKPHKLVVMVYATDELLQDAPALGSFINVAAPEEIAFKLQDALVNGSGVGVPLGALNAGCKIAVAAEGGQVAGTIVTENIVKMWARMYAPCRAKSAWFINQDIEPQLHTMGLLVGTGGGATYMPPNGLSSSPYATLYGRPVVPIEQCATLGTEGDIIFADYSQYFLATKGGVQAASSIHVKFTYDETVFRFVYRVDARPWWATALTPFKGTNTQSPIITLATR